ncbi:hypothetical protein J3458_002086 [Metarhizium acridum]|uniref:uncharacterized protein n=1 Tax=Metarhizium acridum TaxID=92637 RepID=UPI001C6AC4B1|nr:hypothetical protein J3458_002086 [Metarhizium acridum]
MQSSLLSRLVLITLVEGSASTDRIANNTTSQHEEGYVGFVEDPSGRGTASLVLSCLLTLVLCVWSALHLNVPEKNRTAINALWTNLRWIVAGIYSPELVVFAAWRQWCSARMLNAHIESLMQNRKHQKQQSAATQNQQGDKLDGHTYPTASWSMAHSFFSCAGGFAFELNTLTGALVTDSDTTDGESAEPTRLTLTARGILMLADCGRLPVVERTEIEDKGKANDLAKATVIVQATWMLI